MCHFHFSAAFCAELVCLTYVAITVTITVAITVTITVAITVTITVNITVTITVTITVAITVTITVNITVAITVTITVTIKKYLILVYSTCCIFLSVLADISQPIIPPSPILMHVFLFLTSINTIACFSSCIHRTP
jgi:hypothetical protein